MFKVCCNIYVRLHCTNRLLHLVMKKFGNSISNCQSLGQEKSASSWTYNAQLPSVFFHYVVPALKKYFAAMLSCRWHFFVVACIVNVFVEKQIIHTLPIECLLAGSVWVSEYDPLHIMLRAVYRREIQQSMDRYTELYVLPHLYLCIHIFDNLLLWPVFMAGICCVWNFLIVVTSARVILLQYFDSFT